MRVLRPATIGFLSLALAGALATAYTGLGSRFTAQTGGGGACTPTVQEFTTPSGDSRPRGIVTGPDGNLWFVESRENKIGEITTGGAMTEYTIPTANSGPFDIAVGHDGNLWFTESPNIMGKGSTPKIGRITPTGTITEFSIPSDNPSPYYITKGPNNSMWFTMSAGAGEPLPQAVGSIAMSGVVTIFPLAPGVGVADITAGPDGNLWFTLAATEGKSIVKMMPSGLMTEYSVGPFEDVGTPNDITAGPDGHLWFTLSTVPAQVGRMDMNGAVQYFVLNDTNAAGAISDITAGTDGNVWISYSDSNYRKAVARITPLGGITEYAPYPWSQQGSIGGLVWGPDGKLWLAGGLNKITKMTLCVSSPSSSSSGGSSRSSSSSSGGSSSAGSDSSGSASSCPARCGDYIIMAPEECDDAGRNSDTLPNACRRNCTKAHCGDQVIDSGETCDDGNTKNGDGCAANCSIEPTSSSSSSSTQSSSSVSSSKSSSSSSSSSKSSSSSSQQSSSSSSALCGNGRRDGAEKCDDGNTKNGDGCSKKCEVEDGWECRLSDGSSSSKTSSSASSSKSSGKSSSSQSSNQSASTGCPAGALCLYHGESFGACPGGTNAVPLQPYQLCGGGEASRGCYRCPDGSSSSNILIQ